MKKNQYLAKYIERHSFPFMSHYGFDEKGHAYYQLGSNLRVPLSLHSENRQRLVAAMRAELGGDVSGHVVLLAGGGEPIRHCTDHEDVFRQESYFHWAFGVDVPDFLGAIDLSSGAALLFAPYLPPEYAVWMGPIAGPADLAARYGVDACHYSTELSGVLGDKGLRNVHVLHGQNTDSKRFSQPAKADGVDEAHGFHLLKDRLHGVISECRVIKTAAEVAVLRHAAQVSSDAHRRVMRAAKAGLFEFQLESEFLAHCYGTGGCRHVSYTCICASGGNGAVLHYGHSGEPNARQLKSGDMCLFDMGAEYYCYGADITVSFPVGGKFSDDQRLVYNAVLHAQQAVNAALRPGVRFSDMHELAYRAILTDLKAGGLVVGEVDDLLAANVGALFMPHGLGHMLGIDTHDVGGYNGVERIDRPGFRSLRTVRELRSGMYLTNEPGCYFIDSLLRPALENPDLAKFLVRERILHFLNSHFGGVRLEDDVLITDSGCEVLSTVPRSIEDIESFLCLQA